MQFMLRFLRIMRDYALMLAATNYAGIVYASLLHRGQTSQGKCAQVALAFEPVNDIHESKGAWQGCHVVCLIFLTILPRIGGEKNSP